MAQIIKNGVEYNFGSSNTDSSSIEIVTREEYDTLVTNGTVKTGVYYFITENNGTPEWVYDESTGKITGYKTKIGGADTVFPFSSYQIEEVVLAEGIKLTAYQAKSYNITTHFPNGILGVQKVTHNDEELNPSSLVYFYRLLNIDGNNAVATIARMADTNEATSRTWKMYIIGY